jgi:WhiB family redox-sensing transcriptional regulator
MEAPQKYPDYVLFPVTIDEGDMSWLDDAKCRGMDHEIFFPPRGSNARLEKALETCSVCPVATECLEYALGTKQDVGIWGGKSTRQRRIIQQERAREASSVRT